MQNEIFNYHTLLEALGVGFIVAVTARMFYELSFWYHVQKAKGSTLLEDVAKAKSKATT